MRDTRAFTWGDRLESRKFHLNLDVTSTVEERNLRTVEAPPFEDFFEIQHPLRFRYSQEIDFFSSSSRRILAKILKVILEYFVAVGRTLVDWILLLTPVTLLTPVYL